MEMLQGVWEQHLRPRAVVGYGVKIFLPSLPNCVTRSPGFDLLLFQYATYFLGDTLYIWQHYKAIEVVFDGLFG